MKRPMLRIYYYLYVNGISQKELADRLGMKPQAISRIVNGQEPAFPKRGQRIADALDWKEDWQELFKPIELDLVIS